MPELVYRPVVATALTVLRALDLRLDIVGAENIPRTGGAIVASNHISYLDFIIVGATGLPSKRFIRFMAKQEIFGHWAGGPLMRGMRHISVDRSAGAASFNAALRALKDGEVVGVFPEATISRSFTVKQLKNGAARMALDAQVPLVPVAVWGGHRIWTKGRKPKLTRHVHVSVIVGEPITPHEGESVGALTVRLSDAIKDLLARAQADYPQAPKVGEDWWQPAHLGGLAPTPEEAAALDKAERMADKVGQVADKA
jgi:1-acyl-sn-glycerol-3-phosphate acyltransferase